MDCGDGGGWELSLVLTPLLQCLSMDYCLEVICLEGHPWPPFKVRTSSPAMAAPPC